MKKKWSGERLETFLHGDFVSEHLHRYCIVTDYIKDKVVLDIASGEGYGSNLMASVAKNVIGVDIDSDAVTKANAKYKKDNLVFKTGSADNMPIEDNSIDVLVSFETIEHHDKHSEMFREIKRVLKSDGILIMSSPERKFHSDMPHKYNPFHIKELYLHEFEELARNTFKFYDIYFQRYINKASYIAPIEGFNSMKVYSGDFSNLSTRKLDPLYNIVIASDIQPDILEKSIFDGELLTEKMNSEMINAIHRSPTFKIGRILIYPFYKLKKLIKK